MRSHVHQPCRQWIPPRALRRGRWLAALIAAAVVCLGANSSRAADEVKRPPPTAKPKDLPAAEELELLTKDELRLAATYYAGPGGPKAKKTVPVVIMHGWKESGADYKELALFLQAKGHAVVVPDLRGHGRSTRFRGTKKDEDLKPTTMAPAQFRKMAIEDMKTIKDFLWDQNNLGNLNLDKLCVIGAEMGAVVALEFAAFDARGYDEETLTYKNNEPYYGPLKLGGFVKALVLISPKWAFKGQSIKPAVMVPRVQRDLSILIIVGRQDARALDAADRVYDSFKRFHLEPTGNDAKSRKTLFFLGLDTGSQGPNLLDPKFDAPAAISDFIDRRLVNSEVSKDWVWEVRKHPHE